VVSERQGIKLPDTPLDYFECDGCDLQFAIDLGDGTPDTMCPNCGNTISPEQSLCKVRLVQAAVPSSEPEQHTASQLGLSKAWKSAENVEIVEIKGHRFATTKDGYLPYQAWQCTGCGYLISFAVMARSRDWLERNLHECRHKEATS
jgi:rubrerythrin